MVLWRNIEKYIYVFYRFDSDPRFSLFLLYIRSKFCTEMFHIFGLVSNPMTANEKQTMHNSIMSFNETVNQKPDIK